MTSTSLPVTGYGPDHRLSLSKFDGTDFFDWHITALTFFRRTKLLPFLDGSTPEPTLPPTDAAAIAAYPAVHATWKEKNEEAYDLLLLSLDKSQYSLILQTSNAAAAWLSLKETYASTSRTSQLITHRKFFTSTKEPNQTMQDYINTVTTLRSQSQSSGNTHDDNQTISVLLGGLTESYASFLQTIDNQTTLSLSQLYSKLIHEEEKLNIHSPKPPHALSTSQTPPPPLSTIPPSTFCRYCKETTHLIDTCTKLARKRQKDGHFKTPSRNPPPLNPY
jgi:hypothetical protein